MASFRDSGEFRESKGSGAAGQGGGDTRQRRSTRQDAVDLANDMDTSKYSGNLRDAIQRKNIDIKNNQRRVAERIAEDPTRAGFRGFLPSRTDIDAFRGSFGRGLDALRSTFTPGRMIASTIGSALLGPVGGILAGLLANRAPTDAFKTDVRDTMNFFRPNFNVDTPDADIVRAGDFNVMDRITGAIAAPNISTGLQTLFAPRALGLPEDFLDQSAVQTQQLDPVAIGMQYDDFINPNTGMFFDPDRGFIQ